MTVLDQILVGVRQDLQARIALRPLAQVQAQAREAAAPIDPLPMLGGAGLGVIAEVKRASPSKGALAPILDPAALAAAYASGGASVISVLTEGRRFGGSLDDLIRVRGAVKTAVLRKDFILTDYQVWEARAAGADLVLLIVAALNQAELVDLLSLTRELGMTALVEVHTAGECSRALEAGAELIGVNNRDLKTLSVDLRRFAELSDVIGEGAVKVAESGILSIEDARSLRQAGADAVLVGEMLVRSVDPAGAVAKLRSLQ